MATTTTTNTRIVDGREVPPAGRWTIDTVHSQIQFVARHMMISKVRGSFREFSGAVVIGEDPTRSTLEVDIKAASIDTAIRTVTSTSAGRISSMSSAIPRSAT